MIDKKPIKLTQDNFIKSVFKFNGYFCEHFPFCFNTFDLSKNWDYIKDELKDICDNNKSFTDPIKISISKEGLLRRDIFVPNIISYLNLLFFIEENFDYIQEKCYSRESESRISHIRNFDYPTNYNFSIKKRNARFIGFKYKLKIDITNCFNSIYTHSLSWASVGKELSKQIHFTGKKDVDYETLIKYEIGDNLDKLNQKMNGNQTNGILTGPFTSRICSEFILSEIDRILRENKFEFVRYVDDYNFYFISEEAAKEKITEIAQILSEYNLLINKDKIELIKFPFDLLDDYSNEFYSNKNNSYFDAYSLLHKALRYDNDGKKGAIKYLLKVMADKDLEDNNFYYIFGLLINLIFSHPLLSPYIVNVIEKYLKYIEISKVFKRLNEILRNEVNNNHDHEVLWILYIMMKADIPINNETLKRILKSKNDLAIIMCLDRLTNRFDIQDYENIKQVKNDLKEEIKSLNEYLKDTTMTSKHWLLLYTIAKNNYRLDDEIKIYNIKKYQIYTFFERNDINFYYSFYEVY